ncbi:MAG: hypothetical protein KFF73_17385 [Cyclobacteriaceae bacterium]|nr:hypothetical protein [Cyclobacteriaceae bacterium]
MKKGFFYLIICLVVIPAMESCREQEILPSLEGSRLLHEVWDHEIRKVYDYNPRGWPVAVRSKYYYNRYTFNGQDQLIRLEFFTDPGMHSSYMPPDWQDRIEWVSPENTECRRFFSYEYDRAGRLTTILTYSKWDGPFELTDHAALEYDQDGRIIRRNWFDTEGNQRGFTAYLYDQRGNLIEQVKYYSPDYLEPVEKIIYEFDNRKNPYRCFRQTGQPGYYTNPNNIIKEIQDVYDLSVPGKVEYHTETDNHYRYNPDGYPVMVNDAELVYD